MIYDAWESMSKESIIVSFQSCAITTGWAYFLLKVYFDLGLWLSAITYEKFKTRWFYTQWSKINSQETRKRIDFWRIVWESWYWAYHGFGLEKPRALTDPSLVSIFFPGLLFFSWKICVLFPRNLWNL